MFHIEIVLCPLRLFMYEDGNLLIVTTMFKEVRKIVTICIPVIYRKKLMISLFVMLIGKSFLHIHYTLVDCGMLKIRF